MSTLKENAQVQLDVIENMAKQIRFGMFHGHIPTWIEENLSNAIKEMNIVVNEMAYRRPKDLPPIDYNAMKSVDSVVQMFAVRKIGKNVPYTHWTYYLEEAEGWLSEGSEIVVVHIKPLAGVGANIFEGKVEF